PELDRPVGPGAGEQLAVGRPGHVERVAAVALEGAHELAGGDLEGFDELVGRGGGEGPAVGAEGDAVDRVAVGVGDLGHDLAGIDVDELDLAVLGGRAAAGGQELAVGREGQGGDAVGETGDPADEVAGGGVPQEDFAEAAGGERRAVRGEGD